MSIQTTARQVSLTAIISLISVPSSAGFFDDVLDKTKKKLGNTIENVVDKTADKAEDTATRHLSEAEEPPESPDARQTPVKAEQSASAGSGGSHHSVDVVGIRLGMTLAEVQSALRAHNGDLHHSIDRHKYVAPPPEVALIAPPSMPTHVKGLFAYLPGNAEQINIRFAPPPSDNVVNGIMRILMFDKSGGRTFDSLRNAFTKKYGTPVMEYGDAMLWRYANRNQEALNGDCLSRLKGRSSNSTRMPNLTSRPECGLSVLTVMGRQSEGVAGWMKVMVMDTSVLTEQENATVAYRRQLREDNANAHKASANRNPAPRL